MSGHYIYRPHPTYHPNPYTHPPPQWGYGSAYPESFQHQGQNGGVPAQGEGNGGDSGASAVGSATPAEGYIPQVLAVPVPTYGMYRAPTFYPAFPPPSDPVPPVIPQTSSPFVPAFNSQDHPVTPDVPEFSERPVVPEVEEIPPPRSPYSAHLSSGPSTPYLYPAYPIPEPPPIRPFVASDYTSDASYPPRTGTHGINQLLASNLDSFPFIDWYVYSRVSKARKYKRPTQSSAINFRRLAVVPAVHHLQIVAQEWDSPVGHAIAKWGPIRVHQNYDLTLEDVFYAIHRYFYVPLTHDELDFLSRGNPNFEQKVVLSFRKRLMSQAMAVDRGPRRCDTLVDWVRFVGLKIDHDFERTRTLYLSLEDIYVRG